MPEVEYVYTKPEEPSTPKKSHKKLIETLVFLAIMSIVAYFLFSYRSNNSGGQNGTPGNQTFINKTFTSDNETFTITSVPSEYKGSEGLNYIRNNSVLELTKAISLCTDMFGGEWVDTLDAMGCYNMQGFSIDYCSRDLIQTLVSLCNQINGKPECSANHVVCAV